MCEVFWEQALRLTKPLILASLLALLLALQLALQGGADVRGVLGAGASAN